jgi:hypothetical protein
LRNVALFRGAREIEFLGHGEEITNLVHFHGDPHKRLPIAAAALP